MPSDGQGDGAFYKRAGAQKQQRGKIMLHGSATSYGKFMNTDVQWNLDLVDALSFEVLFSAAQSVFPSVEEEALVKPTAAESARAVANLRSWRSYLPETCVARMLDDGWQWST